MFLHKFKKDTIMYNSSYLPPPPTTKQLTTKCNFDCIRYKVLSKSLWHCVYIMYNFLIYIEYELLKLEICNFKVQTYT